MKRIFSEAKDERPGMRYKRAREMGSPEGVSSSPIGREDFNPEKYKSRDTGPRDRGVRDHMRLQWLFKTAFKLIHRHGKGDELDNLLEKGIKHLNRLQSAARVLTNPKKYGIEDDPAVLARYKEDAKESKSAILEMYVEIEAFLESLIKRVVSRIYINASEEDKKKLLTLTTLQDLPQFKTLREDEAEIINDIFFPRGTRAAPEEVEKRVKELVNSFMKLDKEVMDDTSQVHNILTRLKTTSKTANIEKNNSIGSTRRSQNFTDPSAGYKKFGVDTALKRKITSAFGIGDLAEVKAQLSASGRDDLAMLVGKKSEGEIMRSYSTGQPLSESYTFRYDVIVEDLLRKYR